MVLWGCRSEAKGGGGGGGGGRDCASLTFVQALDSVELCLVVLSCFNALY